MKLRKPDGAREGAEPQGPGASPAVLSPTEALAVAVEPALWEPLSRDEKDAERIERPSLTYLQDAWQRLRRNKVAMVSLAVVIAIALVSIIVPFFWRFTYDEQNLDFVSLPPSYDVYRLDDGTYYYITSQYKLLQVDAEGHPVELLRPRRDDTANLKRIYEVDGKALTLDYSLYRTAYADYQAAVEAAEAAGTDLVDVASVPYLASYYAGQENAPEQVTTEKAFSILQNDVQRISLTYDGAELTDTVHMRNATYIFGTDKLGRDMFIRVVYGGRISLLVGFLAAFINLVVGVFYGGAAGYLGGKADMVMMRIVDTIDSIPTTLYVILIMVIVGPGLLPIVLALGLTMWVRMARIVRGQVLTLRNEEFVKASIIMGAGTGRIMTRDLIPNMIGPIMVAVSMQIPSAIFEEAFLSFIGLGIAAPQASWGTMCNDALDGLYIYPYQLFIPAAAISITILALNLLADGLRDAFDPKQRS